ncbi:M42 family metallopeptidase [Candidatus Xianfuyuplasma coldseepsis]|uniref:M42 family metallopeptidase n=1 Tax=Candidatus Xianfuyuplasma coldseepsis TaxID=2782163 RepID=A0A7L7KUN3_9MOLU|nr:M42 family metallopeptidase [Xianfuyuplasma coldseepsis]QMS85704.1 M42 family metallopeptidase [Xianfuyuplasma coldseepsis]
MKINRAYILRLAKEILQIPSPSGYPVEIIPRIKQEASTYNLETTTTKKGNLIITYPGLTDYSVGLSVHVDTLGAMVRSINSKGEIKFTTIGGPIWPTLDGEYCTIKTRDNKEYTGTFLSTSPAIHVYKDAKSKERSPENMYVRLDEVVHNKEDVEQLGIEVGNFIFIDPKTTITSSNFIKSRFLDDKINVASIFGLIQYLQEQNITPKYTIKFIISTYEEVGHGASFIPELDEMIAVDMGCIGDDLTCTEYDVSICPKDSSGPYDYDLTNRLIQVAKANDIAHAVDIYPYYGSDVSAAIRGGNDFKGALLGPGVHASHGMERTHVKAIEATISLLLHYLT